MATRVDDLIGYRESRTGACCKYCSSKDVIRNYCEFIEHTVKENYVCDYFDQNKYRRN